MKKIITSIGMIVFVAALVAGGTGAFFSDTETSVGNTFAAGDIDLRIDNESYVTNNEGVLVASPENSWELTDLTDELFFSFADVKPGDIGEDTISIHPGTNDAFACMAADITATPDNGINDPEADAGDLTDGNGGELQNFLNFSFWEDDGDNVFETGEVLLPDLQGSAATIFDGGWNTIADSGNGPALEGNSTSYVGKAWCFGTLTANGTAQDTLTTSGPLDRGTTGFTCDGSGDNNIAQTDGVTVVVSFYAVQARNNGQFTCESLPVFEGGEVDPEPEEDVYFEGFEVDGAFNWFPNGGSFSVVDTGTDGVTSSDGVKHALANGGIYTQWGAYSSTFPVGGYTTEVDVYLDMTEATGLVDKRFDFSSAINNQGGTHLRDFIFHLGTNPGIDGQWAASVSNNAPGNPLAGVSVDITTSGWYTLQSYFHDVAGLLVVEMNILDSSNAVVGTWTLSPADDIATTVGGNRYGWFLNNAFTDLPFDNARLYLGAPD